MYVFAYVAIYLVAKRRAKRESVPLSQERIMDALVWSVVGLAVGARLFYVIFYEPSFYFSHPLSIIWPFQDGRFTGISGLSFHGGCIGAIIAFVLFCRKNRVNIWTLGDLFIPLIPIGLFFGRIGNFINGELYGRVTSSPIGMRFLSDPNHLRHPSQLYEALLEGIVLFLVLGYFRRRVHGPKLLAFFLGSYAILRFIAEFFREPDVQLGYFFDWMTMGQIFSVGMVVVAGILWAYRYDKKH